MTMPKLFHLLENGEYDEILRLMREGETPDVRHGDESLLMRAVIVGEVNFVKELIEQGADAGYTSLTVSPLISVICSSQPEKVELVKLLVQSGAAINHQDHEGRSALHHAAMHREPDICRILIEASASIDDPDFEGLTPLMHALAGGMWDTASLLLDKGASPHPADENSPAPLYYAASPYEDDSSGVALLLKRGASPNGNKMNRPLNAAAHRGHKKIAAYLLEKEANTDLADYEGITALQASLMKGESGVASLLLDHGASAGISNAKGETALHLAVKSRKITSEVIEMLLKKDQDPFVTDSSGKSAYELAVTSGRPELVVIFDRYAQSPKKSNDKSAARLIKLCRSGTYQECADALQNDVYSQETLTQAFYKAKDRSSRDICRLLLDNGLSPDGTPDNPLIFPAVTRLPPDFELAGIILVKNPDFNIFDENGESPLGYLCGGAETQKEVFDRPFIYDSEDEKRVHNLIKSIVRKGADVNLKNMLGTTPFMHAVYRRPLRTVEFLVDHGANIFTVNKYGDTPLHSASGRYAEGRHNVVQILLKRGADPLQKNNQGETSIDRSEKRGFEDTAELLKQFARINRRHGP